MSEPQPKAPDSDDLLIGQLQNQAKELSCLYRVEEALGRLEEPIDESARGLSRLYRRAGSTRRHVWLAL